MTKTVSGPLVKRHRAFAVLAASFALAACTPGSSTNAPVDASGTGGAAARDAGDGSAGPDASTDGVGGSDGPVSSTGGASATGSGGASESGSGGAGGTKVDPGSGGGPGADAGAPSGSAGRQGGQAGAAGGIGGGSAGQGDGGAGGASAENRGGAGGASSCAGLLCEDFESGAIDPAKWDTSLKGGTLAVQSQQVAHGKFALHAQGLGSGSDDWATLFAKTVPPALKTGTTFGRASMYFSSATAASLHIQFPFAGSMGTGSGSGPAPLQKLRYLEVGSYNGQWQLSMDIHDVSPNIEDSAYAGGKIPLEKWVCVEWEFEDQPERITLWVGGTQAGVFDNMHIDYSSNGTKSGGAIYQGKSSGLIGVFDTFGIGFHDWHPTKAFDLYYDDVVLDTKRIGCPSP